MKFKEGNHVEIINPDNKYYREHGEITYISKRFPSNRIVYQVSFTDTCDIFEENELKLLEDAINNEEKNLKTCRVEQTHNSINEFLKNSRKRVQSNELSLSIIAQMLIEINESLAIICDKL